MTDSHCPTAGICPPCREGWGHYTPGRGYLHTVESEKAMAPDTAPNGDQDRITDSAATPDWHAAYIDAMAKFTAETRTTSYLVGLLRQAQTPCQQCQGLTGSVVLVVGDERRFVCDICVARTPAFTERLATRMREDKPLLDRIAEGPRDAD